jgi:hypothetical protein
MAEPEGFEPSIGLYNPITVLQTAAFSHSATAPDLYFQWLRMSSRQNRCEHCHRIATLAIRQGRVDGRGSPAIVRMKHVGVDGKSHGRLGVPQALRDCDDIHATGN